MWIILTTYLTNILCTSLSHIDKLNKINTVNDCIKTALS